MFWYSWLHIVTMHLSLLHYFSLLYMVEELNSFSLYFFFSFPLHTLEPLNNNNTCARSMGAQFWYHFTIRYGAFQLQGLTGGEDSSDNLCSITLCGSGFRPLVEALLIAEASAMIADEALVQKARFLQAMPVSI